MKELAFEELTRFELRAISILADIHFDMVRSYLKATGLEHGLLLSFATVPLNVKRVIFRPPLSDS